MHMHICTAFERLLHSRSCFCLFCLTLAVHMIQLNLLMHMHAYMINLLIVSSTLGILPSPANISISTKWEYNSSAALLCSLMLIANCWLKRAKSCFSLSQTLNHCGPGQATLLAACCMLHAASSISTDGQMTPTGMPLCVTTRMMQLTLTWYPLAFCDMFVLGNTPPPEGDERWDIVTVWVCWIFKSRHNDRLRDATICQYVATLHACMVQANIISTVRISFCSARSGPPFCLLWYIVHAQYAVEAVEPWVW